MGPWGAAQSEGTQGVPSGSLVHRSTTPFRMPHDWARFMLIWLAKSRGLYWKKPEHTINLVSGTTRQQRQEHSAQPVEWVLDPRKHTVCVARIVCSYGFLGWTLDTYPIFSCSEAAGEQSLRWRSKVAHFVCEHHWRSKVAQCANSAESCFGPFSHIGQWTHMREWPAPSTWRACWSCSSTRLQAPRHAAPQFNWPIDSAGGRRYAGGLLCMHPYACGPIVEH